MSDKISDKDKKAWQNFLSSNEKLPNKDSKLGKKKTLKIKHIDLHGFSLQEANETIEKFIINSYNSGVSKIVVVTGAIMTMPGLPRVPSANSIVLDEKGLIQGLF